MTSLERIQQELIDAGVDPLSLHLQEGEEYGADQFISWAEYGIPNELSPRSLLRKVDLIVMRLDIDVSDKGFLINGYNS